MGNTASNTLTQIDDHIRNELGRRVQVQDYKHQCGLGSEEKDNGLLAI